MARQDRATDAIPRTTPTWRISVSYPTITQSVYAGGHVEHLSAETDAWSCPTVCWWWTVRPCTRSPPLPCRTNSQPPP